MDAGTVGIIVLIATSFVVSVAFHVALPWFSLACFASAVAATALFHLFAYLYEGYADSFVIISVVISFFYALVVSVPVGIVARLVRQYRKKNQ